MPRYGIPDRYARFLGDVKMRAQRWLRDGGQQMQSVQRSTLDLGGCVVCATVALGLQLGGWPGWTLLPAAACYLLWVVLYAEVTVQLERRQLTEGLIWARRFGLARDSPPAPPGKEQRAA